MYKISTISPVQFKGCILYVMVSRRSKIRPTLRILSSLIYETVSRKQKKNTKQKVSVAKGQLVRLRVSVTTVSRVTGGVGGNMPETGLRKATSKNRTRQENQPGAKAVNHYGLLNIWHRQAAGGLKCLPVDKTMSSSWGGQAGDSNHLRSCLPWLRSSWKKKKKTINMTPRSRQAKPQQHEAGTSVKLQQWQHSCSLLAIKSLGQ